jgi:hypothetical protein
VGGGDGGRGKHRASPARRCSWQASCLQLARLLRLLSLLLLL